MKLIIVRHSTSEHNVGNRISGGASDPDLSSSGIELAKKASHYLDLSKIDLVYSSPLKRALHTTEILTKNQKQIYTSRSLLEMQFGSWEGKDATPLRQKYPDAFDLEGMMDENYINYAKGAESYTKLVKRCTDFIDELKQTAQNKTVLIVCHGFTIRGLLGSLFKIDPIEFGVVNNVSFTEVLLDEENDFKPRLKSFGSEKPQHFAVIS